MARCFGLVQMKQVPLAGGFALTTESSRRNSYLFTVLPCGQGAFEPDTPGLRLGFFASAAIALFFPSSPSSLVESSSSSPEFSYSSYSSHSLSAALARRWRRKPDFAG